MNETLGKVHFWLTLVSFYAVFFGMHFLGLGGMPRRYYDFSKFTFLEGLRGPQVFISAGAFVLGAAQLVFLLNFLWSLKTGARAGENPWKAATLEWTAPTPPPHGNWPGEVPAVYRGPYEYAVEAAGEDYEPQAAPPAHAGARA